MMALTHMKKNIGQHKFQFKDPDSVFTIITDEYLEK